MAEAYSEERPVNSISFSGCGFNSPYLVGSCAGFMRYAPHILSNENLHILGASAGAMIAACMLCKVTLQECVTFICELAEDYKEGWWGPFGVIPPRHSVYHKIRRALNARLPRNGHIICSGRLHVSVTRVPGGANELISDFASKEELIEALICSGYIPVLGGYVPQLPSYRGQYYVDGGLSNNSPRLDERTILVTPFCGENDICPRDEEFSVFGSYSVSGTHFCLSLANLNRIANIVKPPSVEGIIGMLDRGYRDTVNFLALHDLISCPRHYAYHMTSDHCVEIGGDFDSEGEEVELEEGHSDQGGNVEGDERREQSRRRKVKSKRSGRSYGPRCRRCHQIQMDALQSSLPTEIRDNVEEKIDPPAAPSLYGLLVSAAKLPFKIAKKTTSMAVNAAGFPVRTSLRMTRTGMAVTSWLLHVVSDALEDGGSSPTQEEKKCLLYGLLTCQFDFTRNFENELFPELSKDLEEASQRSPSFSQSSGRSTPQTTKVGIRVSFTYDRNSGSCSSINSIGTSTSNTSSTRGLHRTEKSLHMLASSLQPEKVEVHKISPKGEVVYRPSSSADMTSPAMAPCQDVLDQLGQCIDMALSDEEPILSCSAEDDQGGIAYKVLHVEDGKLRSPSRSSRLYQSNPSDLAWDSDDLQMVPDDDDDFDLGSILDHDLSCDLAELGPRRAISTPNVSTGLTGPAAGGIGSGLEPQSNSMFNVSSSMGMDGTGIAEDGGVDSRPAWSTEPDSRIV